jgi:hypothetical protein
VFYSRSVSVLSIVSIKSRSTREYHRVALPDSAASVSAIEHTIALAANALISLMARGALFLKVTPCSCPFNQHS